MKTRIITLQSSKWLPIVVVAAFFASRCETDAATNDLAAALQKGLFEEEGNRNLAEAIKAYQAATALFDQDRKLAATAVFRLAECYRKQGNTNDALAQYQRVVREFGDQPEVNTLSRQAVLSLGGTAVQPAVAATPPSTRKEEADEIARIAEMIRNSPDLINARGSGGVTPLYQAASFGQVTVAQYLLDNGADVNSRQGGGTLSQASSRTPLHGAANSGHRAMVELLLNRKADVNAADNRGTTALHLAAEQGFKTVAEVLLARGAEVNARDSGGQTPLHAAAGLGNKVTEVLLAHNASVDQADNAGETPLHHAATRGNKEFLELLLDRKASINARNQNDATPLLLAITSKQADAAKALLARKADPNLAGSVRWENRFQKETPIIMALLTKNDELLELLLKSGAKPNAESGPGAGRPLDLAVGMTRPSAAELLLKNGADPNLPVPPGNISPLRVAIGNQARELVELLLKSKADPNAKESDGNRPLHAAVQVRNKGLVELLLDHKADPELEDGAQKRTALSLACARANREIVELLLTRGANPNASGSGQTPLAEVTQLAWKTSPEGRASYEAIAELLRKHGAAEDLPQLDRIEIRRPSAKFTQTIFYKGTNGWNQFTLFDLVAVHYGFASASTASGRVRLVFDKPSLTTRGALAFPDLANVRILRAGEGGRGRTPERADLLSRLSRQNAILPCQDLALEWGDVIEIPELDHPLTAAWTGFSPEQLARLSECEKRSIQITVKGQVTNLVLTLQTVMPNTPDRRDYPDKVEWAVPQFCLLPVLNQSGLIRSSSDLTRVRVRRSDSSGGGREWVIDCTKEAASDLWLRDGDEIEVPEK